MATYGVSAVGAVEGAARTPDGVTHVQVKDDGDHILRRFDGDGIELETMHIGSNVSVATTRLAIDRGGTLLQTTFTEQPEFGMNLGTRWWCDGHGVESTELDYIVALAAAGDAAHPRAGMLGGAPNGDLWFAQRSGDGLWSYWPVAAHGDWGAHPEDPVDGQVSVRHVREVFPVAVVVDRAGDYRWIWSEIERDEPWVASVGETVGWSLHLPDVTGSSALWIGWLDEHGKATQALVSDSLAARSGDAAIDETGSLHLLVMAGPIWSESYDLWPTYLRLGT